jgi:hypothetical protein
MVEIGSIAAYLALAISLGNTGYTVWNETHKPVRSRQQELRDRLRQALTEAQDDCRTADAALTTTSTPLNAGIPAGLEQLTNRIEGVIQDGLTLPGRRSMQVLTPRTVFLFSTWHGVKNAQKRLTEFNDGSLDVEYVRQISAAQAKLLTEVRDVLREIGDFIRVLTDIDNGVRKTKRQYRF